MKQKVFGSSFHLLHAPVRRNPPVMRKQQCQGMPDPGNAFPLQAVLVRQSSTAIAIGRVGALPDQQHRGRFPSVYKGTRKGWITDSEEDQLAGIRRSLN